jgi:triosephosphate isomerase
MRKLFIAGNWKMNKTIAQSVELAQSLVKEISNKKDIDIGIIPQFMAIPAVAKAIEGSTIQLGAQDVYFEKSGAFTGEISCEMLADAGASYALVGHSERRHVLGESDEIVRKKLDALLDSGLGVVLCVGEKLDERESGKTKDRLNIQIQSGLQNLSALQLSKVTIAYEPVWAIGTGKTASSIQAQEAHAFIRGLIKDLAGQEVANSIRIQYGGSVKAENAEELMFQPDVDGALVGGASLKPEPFLGIIGALKND